MSYPNCALRFFTGLSLSHSLSLLTLTESNFRLTRKETILLKQARKLAKKHLPLCDLLELADAIGFLLFELCSQFRCHGRSELGDLIRSVLALLRLQPIVCDALRLIGLLLNLQKTK